MLEKRASQLSADELNKLRKSLGVPGRPFPMRDSTFVEDSKGGRTLVQRLGVLEDAQRPLDIYSDRSYAEVAGLAYREMPTPSMLALFFDALTRRKPDSKRRIQYLKGAPGAGKTFMSELIGRMRDPRGPIIVNCGDKNLSELLFETVLDFSADRKFYSELEKRLNNGAMNDLSVRVLKEALGEAFVEQDGKITIDWNAIKETTKALDGLKQVSQLEGLDDLGGNALGMATQEGPLIRAWKDGREIVLDEYNKSKEGTDGGLQTVLQFLAGEVDECTVENSLKEKGDQAKQTFTFRRGEIKVGFFTTLTGNSEEDGTSTRELSQSVHSRVHPQLIPNATEEDWQHRICQILTGVPISTLYRSSEEQWKEDPEAFRQLLVNVRTLGMTKEQVKNIPELQLRLLRRWEDVLKASQRLAKFYYGWSMLVNPESDLMRTGKLGALMMEIDERYKSEVSIDFRKILDHIKEAMEFRPDVKSSHESEGYSRDDWNKAPVLPKTYVQDDPIMQFGTRLCSVIINHISKTSADIGKVALFKQMMVHAADCGVLEARLTEAKKSDNLPIPQLLDENPFDSRSIELQAVIVRNMICAHIRENNPEVQAADDEILSPGMVKSVIEQMEAPELEVEGPAPAEPEDAYDSNEVVVINPELESVSGTPLTEVSTLDLMRAGPKAAELMPTLNDLLRDDDLLATLAMPRVGDRNLSALWNNAISRSGLVAEGDGDLKDASLKIAEGHADHALALTTVMVRHETAHGAKASPLHILWNRDNDRIMIVGDHLRPSLTNIFQHRGITFISRDDKNALSKIKAALPRVLGPTMAAEEVKLKTAFLMRNMMEDQGQEDTASLAELLVHKDVKNYLPNYILNRTLRPEPLAA
ncbi:MAG: hypothetical protein ACXW30_06995 [Micavibrio sp.]